MHSLSRFIPIFIGLLFYFQIDLRAQTPLSDTGTVQVYVDKRMELLTNKPKEVASGKQTKVQDVKGFRVQIYYGTSRQEAADAKTIFMKKYPSVRSYLSFTSPQYRLKVGDFKTKAEADVFADNLRTMFKTIMVVSEKINVSNSKK